MGGVPVSADDWRRMGQEDFLPPGTRLVYAPYHAAVDSWETEHCLFCFTPFLAPDVVESNVRLRGREGLLTSGYTTTEEHREGAGSHWVCAPCMQDFGAEYQLTIEGGPRTL
jgi:hypothetical protein